MLSFLSGFLTCYLLGGALISSALLSEGGSVQINEVIVDTKRGNFILKFLVFVVIALLWPVPFGWSFLASKKTTPTITTPTAVPTTEVVDG